MGIKCLWSGTGCLGRGRIKKSYDSHYKYGNLRFLIPRFPTIKRECGRKSNVHMGCDWFVPGSQVRVHGVKLVNNTQMQSSKNSKNTEYKISPRQNCFKSAIVIPEKQVCYYVRVSKTVYDTLVSIVSSFLFYVGEFRRHTSAAHGLYGGKGH